MLICGVKKVLFKSNENFWAVIISQIKQDSSYAFPQIIKGLRYHRSFQFPFILFFVDAPFNQICLVFAILFVGRQWILELDRDR